MEDIVGLMAGKEYKVAVVGTEELALGLRLLGIREAYTAENASEAEAMIKKLLQRDDIGLIILTSNLVRGIRDKKLLSLIDTSILPMFIEVQGYRGEYKPDTLRRLILKAIGIDISKSIGN